MCFHQPVAASQEFVVDSAQRVVVARARSPRDAAVQHCLVYLGSWCPDFELEGSTRSVVQFEGVLPEAAPCVTYAPVDRDGQVGIVVDIPPEVYKLVRVVLYTWPAVSTLNMAVDSDIPFARKHMISVLASNTARPNAAHSTPISPPSCQPLEEQWELLWIELPPIPCLVVVCVALYRTV